MNKYLHILRLLNRKFYLLYLLLFCNTIAFIPLIFSDWLNIFISVDLKIPFSDVLIQPKTIYFTGKEILGYFSLLPFIPLMLVYFQSTRDYAWIVSTLIMLVTIIHLTNLYSVYNFIQSQSLDALIFKMELGRSLFAFFGLSSVQTLVAFLIHKTS